VNRPLRKRRGDNDAKIITEAILASHRTQLKGLDKEMEKLANKAAREVKKTINQQTETWEPLNEDYEAFKKRTGLDTRTLVATKEYRDSITVTKEDICRYRIGPPLKKKHSSGLPLWKLAKLLEYGNAEGNLPPRPHYRPVLERIKEELKAIVQKLKGKSRA
jgi:hypothetical protein